MQLDLAVLQLCDDCVVVKVLGGVVELPDERVSLLVLHGIVELQLVSKELRLQWRLQRRRKGGSGEWEEEETEGKRSSYTHVIMFYCLTKLWVSISPAISTIPAKYR